MTHATKQIIARALILTLLSSTAHAAFDPYAGSDDSIPSSAQRAAVNSRARTPAYGARSITYYPPQQLQAAPTHAPAYRSVPVQNPAPTAPAPINLAAEQTGTIAPPPPVSYTAPAPTPVTPPAAPIGRTVSAPAPIAAAAPRPIAPAYVPTYAPSYAPANTYAPAPAYAPAATMPVTTPTGDSFSLGLEGFRDLYQEKVVRLREHANFGSITGSYNHFFTPEYYGAIEGRASYGKDNYKSPSGNITGIEQWEFENRLLAGYRVIGPQGGQWKFYAGLGARYFDDRSKGEVTDTGALGYDRRILQFYAPLGINYTLPLGGLIMNPVVEVDPLLYGHVNSRLQNVGYYELKNTQHSGYGLRGEFMIGTLDDRGIGWQAGPFVRYWHINDSNTHYTPDGYGWLEPKNTRLQYGASLRYLF
jgi:hypothetical protein